jgi:hypothetical protein
MLDGFTVGNAQLNILIHFGVYCDFRNVSVISDPRRPLLKWTRANDLKKRDVFATIARSNPRSNMASSADCRAALVMNDGSIAV